MTLLSGSLVLAALIFFAKTPEETFQVAARPQANESLPTQNAPAAPNANNQELIQDIASGIAQEIISNNPDGPANAVDQLQITAIHPDAIAQKLLQGEMAIDYSKFSPEIKLADLRILAITDKKLAEDYFKNAEGINARNFSNLSVDFSKSTSEDLKALVSAYGRSLEELYSLLVPSNLASIHLEKIRLLTFQKNLFENISNYQSDPMAAMISLRMFDKAYSDMSALSKKMADFAIQNGLNI